MAIRSPRASLVIAACGPMAMTACSLVYGLDGYAGDPLAAQDGSDERPLGDGGVLTADADGAAAADADAAAKFCDDASATTRLCDDFERGTVQGPWGKVREEGLGKATLGKDKYGSFLHATLVAGSVVGRACLERHVTMTIATRVHWAFRIRILDQPTASVQVMQFGVGTPAATMATLGITITPSTAQMYEQSSAAGSYKSFPLSRPLTPGMFHEVDVVVTLATSPARIVVSIDGKEAATRDSTVPFGPATDGFFQAGASYALPTPDIVVDVDNVLIETE